MAHTRITAVWNGLTGSPGYTGMNFTGTLDSTDAAAAATKMRTFFNAIVAFLPVDLNLTIVGIGQHYNSAGQLEGEVTFTPPAPVNGSGTGAYSAPTGAVVNWITNAFRNGRRFRGRTYLVPLTVNAYDTAGTLSSLALTTIGGAATALITGSPDLCIFGGSLERGFATASVTGSSVPDRAAVLRSRRD